MLSSRSPRPPRSPESPREIPRVASARACNSSSSSVSASTKACAAIEIARSCSAARREERKLDEHFDLHARELTVLDERQRALSMLEHDVQRLAALMREISEERRSLGSGLLIAGGEGHALCIREDIRALGVA